MSEKDILRKEHNIRVQNKFYEKTLGKKCVNCGSTVAIEYHHIVPLCMGGTNKITNIAPVCNRCHKAIHGEKDYREYKLTLRNNNDAVSKKMEIYDKDIQNYINCKITKEALVETLGVKNAPSHSKYYRAFLEAHGIKTVVNKVDSMIKKLEYPPPVNTIIGYIVYKSGRVENIYYSNTNN